MAVAVGLLARSQSTQPFLVLTQSLAAEGQGQGLGVSEPAAAGAELAMLGGQELQHLLRLVVLRAESAGRQAVAQVAPLSGSGRLGQSFKVRVGDVRVGEGQREGVGQCLGAGKGVGG